MVNFNRLANFLPSSTSSGAFIPTTVAAAFVTGIVVIWFNKKKNKKIPGDHGSENKELPLAACAAETFFTNLMQQDGYSYVLTMCRQLGEVFCVDLAYAWLIPENKRIYVVSEHRAARKILENSTSVKWEPDAQFLVDTTNGGMNMIAANGHRWKHVRKSTAPAFSSQNMARLVKETIEPVLDEWIEQVLKPLIAESGKDSKGLDILNEMIKITSDVITRGAFDYKLQPHQQQAFLRNILICWQEFAQETAGNTLRMIPYIRCMFSGIRQAKQAAKEMFDMCEKMLQEYRDKPEKKPHMLIHMIMNDTEYADDSERIRDMIAYVIAGFDTTANTLAFAFRELALHPDEQSKLRSALRQCSTIEEAANCPALKHVLREVMRLYPAVAVGSMRKTGADIVLPDSDHVVPSNSVALLSYYAIHRNEKVFREPDTFIPARWENPSDAEMRSVMTFSAGYRNCQGQALAQTEMVEILHRLFSKYEFGIVEKGEPTSVVFFKPVGTYLSVKVAA